MGEPIPFCRCPYSPCGLDGILVCDAQMPLPRLWKTHMTDTAGPDAPPKRDWRQQPRSHRMQVWATEGERAEIERLAALTGNSVSAYLRTVGLGAAVRSTQDYQAVLELAKVAADLGRLGGLLKLWLTEKRGQGAPVADVNRLLHDTRDLQARMREQMGRL